MGFTGLKYPLFCTKDCVEELSKQGICIDTSSDKPPYNVFSPFHVWPMVIPVPGMLETYSKTVEGVWQGLKLIAGRIDKSLFDAEKIRKRRGEGKILFLLGEEKIDDYAEARKRIYVPTYEWVFHNLVSKEVKQAIYDTAVGGTRQYFFDVDANPDIEDTDTSLSHSSLLVTIINKELEKLVIKGGEE